MRCITYIFLIIFTITLLGQKVYSDQDLDFIYKTIKNNHPGIYNKLDPHFISNLDIAYTLAKQELDKPSNNIYRKIILNKFIDSFHDNHLYIRWYDEIFVNSKFVPELNINHLSEQIVWIKLDTFDLDNEGKTKFKKLLDETYKLKNKKVIVFDLRGNQGGNSEYSTEIVKSLFNDEYVEYKKCLAEQNQYIDWRASTDNLLHIESLYTKYQSDWLLQIIIGMQMSIDEEEIYYRERSLCNLKHKKQNVRNKLTAKIIVIIDSGNFSAALDFIDDLKLVTKPLLIGKKTKSDRLYMEVRTVSLPSNIGNFSFPIKVYRNRMRGDNESYSPDIKFDDIKDDTKLQSFIINFLNTKN